MAVASTRIVSDAEAKNLRIKARLDPSLDGPYFEEMRSGTGSGCSHTQHGVKLDMVAQRCYCRSCGLEIHPFTALENYHKAEQHLVRHVLELKRRDEAEIARKARDKERRPFMRNVVSRVEVRDESLKAEPHIGYVNTLECGHKREQADTRMLGRMNCHDCKHDAWAKANPEQAEQRQRVLDQQAARFKKDRKK